MVSNSLIDGLVQGARLLVLVAMSLLPAGCRSVPRESGEGHSAVVQQMVRTELFFGLSRPGGGAEVSEGEFQAFLEDEVTPRFPDGYTVVVAEGRWGSNGVTVREPSRILIILSPAGASSHEKIEAIRSVYKARFGQEAVLRVDEEQAVSF